MQRLLEMLAKKCSFFEDFKRSRVGPPSSPTGNSMCVAGFRCLGAAFSGLPILTPMLVENLFLIKMPDDLLRVSGTGRSPTAGFFLNSRLKKILASCESKIIISFCIVCGTPRSSSIFFARIGYLIIVSFTSSGSKSTKSSLGDILSQKYR